MSEERRYGQWAGDPKGAAEDVARCVKEVPTYSGSFLYMQCSRKRGHGRDGLYCKVHARRHPAQEDSP